MDLHVIDVTEDEAAQKLAEYAAVAPADRGYLDEALARAYRAVSGGGRLIRLSEAILAGGFDERGMPRLAVAGAEWRTATCWWANRGDLIFADDPNRSNRGAAVGHHSLRISYPEGTRPPNAYRAGLAIVPMVPPAKRPRRGVLSRCHILWEAEWDMSVPRDPALLRHVAGGLWRVLSEWDLTELERAVLERP
jgi:hypothetical protein